MLMVLIYWAFYSLAFQAEGVLSLPAYVRLSICELYLVRMITRYILGLELPNLYQIEGVKTMSI